MDDLRPQDPARMGAYRLLARLGAGGMGQVYLGRSPGGRLVAVKVIRDEISDHPEALTRFRREAATVETVRSAYTAQLIEASLDASPYWLATEYVEGPTLRGAVEAGGPFPPDSALRLFAALAEGLAAVHVHGVTHRDLKPQNVILSPQGPQLIDFGIARGLDQTFITRDGMATGTPGFAAPEVIRRNAAGPAADVFALGATLAYTVTGRAPFGSGDPSVVSYRAVYEDIDLAGVRPALAALIRDCVAKDPADRPDPATVIARCAVDSALATDPHYRSLVRGDDPVPVREAAGTEVLPGGPAEHEGGPAEREDGPAEREDGPTDHEDGPAERGRVAAPPRASVGPTPYDGQDASSRPARRRGFGLAACALVVAAAALVWQFTDPGGGSAGGAKGSGASDTSGTSSQPRSSVPPTPAGPPGHILNDRVSKDRWTLSDDPGQAAFLSGSCDQSDLSPDRMPMNLESSVSHTTGTDTATVTLRPKESGEGDRPDPYYLAVGVRPPHETDRATGRPTKSVSKGIGFTSKPFDLYSRWSSGGTITLKYPADFRAHFGGDGVVDALPVGDDRGDWTVVFYHVEGGPTEYTSVVCNGFHA
ncbi:serine/threonine-protein kinase [Streptomyces clavifer]|uniref:serine/threonine-protein kinase n=1 Tax=Streptomyces clavifer TaxID=68188 RepID=UPI0033FB0322